MQYDRATGWLVGAETGPGMAAMFTMNEQRNGFGVGGQASASPEAGPINTRWPMRWTAKQGKTQSRPRWHRQRIVDHS